jgi:hypothetical protein
VCKDGGLGAGSTCFWSPEGIHLVVFGLKSSFIGSWDLSRLPVFEGLFIAVGETSCCAGGGKADTSLRRKRREVLCTGVPQ